MAAPVALLWLQACAGTSTGNPNADPTIGPGYEDASSGCDVEASDIDDDDDGLGFSADDVLDAVRGTHVTSLRWHDSELLGSNPAGETELRLGIARGDGTVQLLERELEQHDHDGPVPAIDIEHDGPVCPDALAIPVTVTLATDDGALDETVEAQLVVERAEVIHLRLALPADMLEGSLSLQLPPTDAEERIVTLSLSAQLSHFGQAGTLSVSVEERTPDAVSQGGYQPLARFPADSACVDDGLDVDGDTDVGGFTPDDLQAEMLAALAGTEVTWPDGERSALSVSFADATRCVEIWSGGIALDVDVRATVQSADGRIDTTLPMQWSPAEAQGVPLEIALHTVGAHEPRSTVAVQAAVPEVDLSDFDHAVLDLHGTFTRDDAGALLFHGGVRVAGIVVPDCAAGGSQSGDGDDEGAQTGGSAGCAGPDEQDVLHAAITPVH